MKEFSLRLRKHNLKLFPSKATIGGTDADFFGHTLSPADIMPNALFFFFFYSYGRWEKKKLNLPHLLVSDTCLVSI